MKNLTLFIALFLLMGTANAQDLDKPWKQKLYFGVVLSPYLDWSTSPIRYVSEERIVPDPNDPSSTTVRTVDIPFQSTCNSPFTIGLEGRYNVHEFTDNIALAVAAPVTIGIGATSAASSEARGVSGFGNFQVPVLGKVYIGAGSTSRSFENAGFCVGAGYEMNKLAIINTSQVSASEREAGRAWIMPTVSAGFTLMRGGMPTEFNLKYGFGSIQSQRVNSTGNPITSGERLTRASSIKLTFVYMLGY